MAAARHGSLNLRQAALTIGLGLLMVNGAGWIGSKLSPFLLPGVDVGFLMVTFSG